MKGAIDEIVKDVHKNKDGTTRIKVDNIKYTINFMHGEYFVRWCRGAGRVSDIYATDVYRSEITFREFLYDII